jgi:hypothetical protein
MIPALSGHDSFPISTYPMYAFRRESTDRFPSVLGEDATATLRPLSTSLIAGSDDPLIAEAVIAQAIRNGSAMRLCERVAGGVGAEISRVLVVEEVHDVVDRARNRPSLQERIVHATCDTA